MERASEEVLMRIITTNVISERHNEGKKDWKF